jgi:hypothetical protein
VNALGVAVAALFCDQLLPSHEPFGVAETVSPVGSHAFVITAPVLHANKDNIDVTLKSLNGLNRKEEFFISRTPLEYFFVLLVVHYWIVVLIAA